MLVRRLGFSAISFEMWYLLHFKRSASPFASPEALISILKKYYPGYEKAKQNDFANLKPYLEVAIENSIWVRKHVFDETKHITNHSIWTDIDKLVTELITTS
ncbi:RloB domain-containing protein [bacterium]|nr:RloB domain-containing protein [bacterium]